MQRAVTVHGHKYTRMGKANKAENEGGTVRVVGKFLKGTQEFSFWQLTFALLQRLGKKNEAA